MFTMRGLKWEFAQRFSSAFQNRFLFSIFSLVSTHSREPPSKHNAYTKRRLQYLSIWSYCFGIDFSISISLGNVFIHLSRTNDSRFGTKSKSKSNGERDSKRGRQSKNKLNTLNKHGNALKLRHWNRTTTTTTTLFYRIQLFQLSIWTEQNDRVPTHRIANRITCYG